MERKNNLYDWLLIIQLLSLAFGYMTRNVFTMPSHIVAIAFSPIAIKGIIELNIPSKGSILICFLIVWCYGFLSLMWTPHLKQGLLGMVYLSIHLLICIEMIVFSRKANNPMMSIVNGWIIAYLITVPIAIWELRTDNHIMSVHDEGNMYLDNGSGIRLEKHIAAVTFYNPNTYCMFLAMAFLFLLYKISMVKKPIQRYFYILALFILIFILFANGSRGSLLSIAIMFAVFAWISFIKGVGKTKRTVFLLMVVAIIVYYYLGDVLFEVLRYRLATKDLLEDNARIIIWENAWQLVKESYGFGTGINSMDKAMGKFNYITYPHNLWLELMLDGGIVFLIPFILLLVRMYKSARVKSYDAKILLYGALLSHPLYGVINSEYIKVTFVWCFFASFYPLISSGFDDAMDEKRKSLINSI